MNIEQITDRNLNVRQLRNRGIPVTTSQVPSHISDLNSSVPLGWSNPPQKSNLRVQDSISVRKPRPKAVSKVYKCTRKVNKLHPLPKSVQVHKYKLDISREHYHKDTPQPSLSKMSQTEAKIQNSQHQDKSYPCVNSHGVPPAPQSQMVNDSSTQEVSERDPQIQVITTNMSHRIQNQSSRQSLMASIKARRSFFESTDSSSDMNPDSAVVIEDTLVKMA